MAMLQEFIDGPGLSRAQAQTKHTAVSAAKEGHSDESACTAPVRAH